MRFPSASRPTVYLGKWDDSKYQAELHAALEQRAAEEDPGVDACS